MSKISFVIVLSVDDSPAVSVSHELKPKHIAVLREWVKRQVNGEVGKFAFLAPDKAATQLVEMSVFQHIGSTAYALTKLGELILPEVIED